MSEIVAEAVRHNLAKSYADGFKDGIAEVLDQLENRSEAAPEGGYRGPLPEELTTWIVAVRRRLVS